MNDQEMLIKMLNQAQYELMNYPRMGAGYYLLKPLRDLFGVSYHHKDKMAFPNAVLAKALMDYYKKHVNTEEGREVFELVKRYYDRWLFTGARVRGVEDAYAGMALIDLHEITGNKKYKDAADGLAQYLLACETDDAGSVISRPNKGERFIYADAIGYMCPFLAKYGRTYENTNAYSLAVT